MRFAVAAALVAGLACMAVPAQAVQLDPAAGGGSLERLVPNDAPGGADTYSVASFGGSFSWNGRYVTYSWGKLSQFQPYPTPHHFVVRDLTDNSERIFSAGNYWPGPVSDDGRYTVFTTDEALTAEDTDTLSDVYRWDLETGEKTLQSAAAPTAEAAVEPRMSADGNRIVFTSDPTPPANEYASDSRVFVRDVAADSTLPLARTSTGTELSWRSESASISGDGSAVAFVSRDPVVRAAPGEGLRVIYLQDLDTWQPIRISSNKEGWPAYSPVTDATGDTVVFSSGSYSLGTPDNAYAAPGIRVFDRLTEVETAMDDTSAGPGGLGTRLYEYPVLSANGRYVGFTAVLNTATRYWQGLIYDRWEGTTSRVARRTDGELPTRWHGTILKDISPDGRQFTFDSDSDDLVDDFRQTSAISDTFLRTYDPSHGLPDTKLNAVPGVTAPTPTFTFAAHAWATYRCRIDDGSWTSCTSPHKVSALPEGKHEFAVRATDADSREEAEQATATFIVDATAPQTPELNGPAGLINDSTPTWTFTDAEETQVQCRVDAAGWQPCTSPWSPALGEGEHQVAIRAVDSVGNADPAPQTRSITVDTLAPVVTIKAPAARTRDTTPTINFSASGAPAGVTCQVDGGPARPCASPFTATALSDGPHSMKVSASDLAGNASVPRTVSFVVDTRAPQTSMVKAPRPITTDRTPSFVFRSSEGGATFQCQLDSRKWVTCGTRWTAAKLGKGGHVLLVRAKDLVGNVDATPTKFRFTVRG